MKTIKWVLWLALISVLFCLQACKKDLTVPDTTIPVVVTTPVSDITATTAMSGGDVTSDGNLPIISKGICWSTSPDPLVSDNKTSDGTGAGKFTSYISNIQPGTTYYLRAYAANIKGFGYGQTVGISMV